MFYASEIYRSLFLSAFSAKSCWRKLWTAWTGLFTTCRWTTRKPPFSRRSSFWTAMLAGTPPFLLTPSASCAIWRTAFIQHFISIAWSVSAALQIVVSMKTRQRRRYKVERLRLGTFRRRLRSLRRVQKWRLLVVTVISIRTHSVRETRHSASPNSFMCYQN